MTDNLEQKSFLRRQWEAYKLVEETVRNKSLLQDFIASDPVNGPIVKATQDTRGKAHIATGIVIFGSCWRYGWKNRRKIANDDSRECMDMEIEGYWKRCRHCKICKMMILVMLASVTDGVQLVALIVLPPLAARVTLDFGISAYLLRNKDKRDAYVEFNEWLQKRA